MILGWISDLWLTIKYGFKYAIVAVIGGIFSIVDAVYRIFLTLASMTNILSADEIESYASGIYYVLGVIVLFALAYNVLLYVIDPDKNSGETSVVSLLKNIVITFVLIAVIPTIFDFAGGLVSSLVSDGTVLKVVFGENASTDKEGGSRLSVNVFSTFFTLQTIPENGDMDWDNVYLANEQDGVDLGVCPGDNDEEFKKSEGDKFCSFGSAMRYAVKVNSIRPLFEFAANLVADDTAENTSGSNHSVKLMDFQFLACIGCGIFLLYVLVSYCFDLGIRVVKIAFYQIIAPLCIACRLLPKQKDIYNKWKSLTIKAYLLVFVRVLVMALGVEVIEVIAKFVTDSNTIDKKLCTGLCRPFVFVFLAMGVFAFMKQLPKMIEDVIGEDTGLGKKVTDKFKEGGGLIGGAALGAAAVGAGRAGVNGVRNFKNAAEKRAAFKKAQQKLNDYKGNNAATKKKYQSELNKAKEAYNASKKATTKSWTRDLLAGTLGSATRAISSQTDGFGTKGVKDMIGGFNKDVMASAIASDAAYQQRLKNDELRAKDKVLSKLEDELIAKKAEIDQLKINDPSNTAALAKLNGQLGNLTKEYNLAKDERDSAYAESSKGINKSSRKQWFQDTFTPDESALLDKLNKEKELVDNSLKRLDESFDKFTNKFGSSIDMAKMFDANKITEALNKNKAFVKDDGTQTDVGKAFTAICTSGDYTTMESMLSKISSLRDVNEFSSFVQNSGNTALQDIYTTPGVDVGQLFSQMQAYASSAQNIVNKEVHTQLYTNIDNIATSTGLDNSAEYLAIQSNKTIASETASRVGGTGDSSSYSGIKKIGEGIEKKISEVSTKASVHQVSKQINDINSGNKNNNH